MIGKTISHYKILEKLGEGGMGIVYKAEDKKLNRTVALKFLWPQFLGSKEQKSRFVQEAQAAALLDHPNICTVYEIDEVEGQIFIAMAYLEGQSLEEKIQSGPLKLDETIEIAIQVAQGLEEAHQKGVVHRDIKSDNISVTSKGQAKIMDFGLAKPLGGTLVTKEGVALGTVAYMSPEQAQGAKVDHRTDIWSLGVVLYEMLTRELPFKGEYEQAVIYSILNENPEPITSLRAGITLDLETIVNRCVEKELSARYQQVDELIVDLKGVKRRLTQLQDNISASLKSIAVLPFDNISPDKENEYFSDGLTEEIITNLSKIRSMKVISRTSIMPYKGVRKPLKQIAGELRVQYILEGSVRKQGNDLRISAQLIDTSQDTHLWAEKYRGTVEDVFDIQEKVADEIARALKVQLTPHEQKDLKKRYTENAEAYQLYLRGRYYAAKFTKEGLNKGIQYFNQAIAIDSDYVPAYEGLVYYYFIANEWYLSPKEAMPKAKEAAKKVLEIDEMTAYGHASLGMVNFLYDWDWSAAEKEFKRAIELNPNYVTAHEQYGFYLAIMGRFEEAIANNKRAWELDPLSLETETFLGISLYFARQYEQAIDQLLKAIDMEPNYFFAHLVLGRVYEQKGLLAEAIGEFQKARLLEEGVLEVLAALGRAYAVAGKTVEAHNVLNQLSEKSKTSYVPPYHIAAIYAGLGEKEQAFAWLEKAYEERSLFLTWLKVDPNLDSLRTDPRFFSLLKKVGLEK